MSRPARRVVVLCDNESSRPDCGCEWGLSLAIDLGDPGGLWLWDTGKTGLLLQNAAVLGVDVRAARGLALSHGHYDHTGGLSALVEAGFSGPVHGHAACACPRFADEKGRPKQIGPPRPLPPLAPTPEVASLAPGLALVTNIPRLPGNFQAVRGFSLDPEGTRPDTVPDDAFLLLDTAQGPVMILGCCHSGLANSLAAARDRLGHARVHSVLGGLHLFQAGPEAVAETAQALREFNVQRLIAGHCTGPDRLAALRSQLPEIRVQGMATGQFWEF